MQSIFILKDWKLQTEKKVKIIDLAEENLTPAISETINTIRSIWNESETNNKPSCGLILRGDSVISVW